MLDYRKIILPSAKNIGAAAAALVLALGAKASAGNDFVGYYHRDEHGNLVFEELDPSRYPISFGHQSRSHPSTAIVQDLYFCDFDSASIQGRYIAFLDSFYNAAFTFNRDMLKPDEVARLDTALTNPLIPNTLLIYFRPDTISTGARENFEIYPRNRIIYIPELADTNELLQAIDDSVKGWIKKPTCGVTGVRGPPETKRASWGEVKSKFRDETPHVERRFTTGKRGRNWR
jgi:hypothetical protein